MRLKTAGKKESKFGDLSSHSCACGTHNRENEICKVNWKSHPELTSTDRDKIVPNKLPSSDDRSGKIGTVYVTDSDSGKCKMAVGAESGKTKISKDADSDRNKTIVVTENKENEADIGIANKVIVTQREKDFSRRQEKLRDPSDDDSSNEDSDNECTENKEELTRKPVLNNNIPSDSVSDVENQLKNLAITQSGDGKGDLCERSPMVSERHRVRSDLPYPQVSSQLRCNGGGIVAESPAPTGCLYSLSPSAIVHFNINELTEANNNVLPSSGPEYPFGEASSSPESNNNFLLYGEESCPLPVLLQKDLDPWLNSNGSNVDKGSTDIMNGSQLGYIEVRDDPCYSPNTLTEQNDLCSDVTWSRPLTSSKQYRQPESIHSISSPSSGSHYSECSPLSSPVSSPADSVTGRSDSDTENELLKIGSIGYNLSDVPSSCAHSVNDGRLNKLVTSNVTCSPTTGYPLPSDLYTCCQLSHSANGLSSQPAESFIPVQSVHRANPAVSGQSPTGVLLTEHAGLWQQALPDNNCLQLVPSSLQSAQVAGHHCSQPIPTAIKVQPSCPLASPTNTPTLIIPNNVHPPLYMPIIQQGPVIPETVPVSARERIAAKVDKAMKDRVVMTLAKLPDDQLSRGDKHGDTQLMILIVNDHPHKLEQIYVMVSRLKNIPGALVARNAQNQSALSLACLFLHNVPLVARFIAEVMLEQGLPVDEEYDEGNTLLHLLCAQGDSHVYVLAELLSMKDRTHAPCFDINQHNHREGTPLHVAIKKHSKKVNCSQTVAFLLSQGADMLAQERCGGLTALHMAIKESCDILLVQLLLQAAERRNINLVSKGDYPGDTALHYIALRNDIALHQQARVFQLLVRYGAKSKASNRCGSQGRTPLALVSTERKHEIQKIIHKR